MKNASFPITGAKKSGVTQNFDLTDPQSLQEYFQAKASEEIETIKDYLQNKQFIGFFVGKKNAGKGTYSKLFSELIGKDKIVHLSVGDLVRDVHGNWEEYIKSPKGKKLKDYYRGFISFEEAQDRFLSRSASNLLPSEFILALLRVEFDDLQDKSIFLDGFPRDVDQIGYSLFFKEIMGREEDKDMFILIDIPDSVINERIKSRRICPICNTPRNLKLLPTSSVGFDSEKQEFYLMCDNPACNKARMVGKEGDELGIEPIKERLEKDQEIINKSNELYGIQKVLLRNSIPVTEADQYFDKYELTPAFGYELDGEKVKTVESPWTVKDNEGVESYSLMPAPVAIALLKQMSKILGE